MTERAYQDMQHVAMYAANEKHRIAAQIIARGLEVLLSDPDYPRSVNLSGAESLPRPMHSRFSYDPEKLMLTSGEKKIRLTIRESEVFSVLLERLGSFVGPEAYVDLFQGFSSHEIAENLKPYVKRIRIKFKSAGIGDPEYPAAYIEALGRGKSTRVGTYRMIDPERHKPLTPIPH